MTILSTITTYLPDFIINVILPETFRWVVFLAIIWVPAVLVEYAWEKWLEYVRAANAAKSKKVLLEIKLPRETFKSPKAMELVLNTLHVPSDGTWYKQYWEGGSRPQYSLEIVSIEGSVKFMIWLEDSRKAHLMAALYSQYPGIEIHEREDYAMKVDFDPKQTKVWAVNMKLTKPDPYPIKTYVDYGLDKDPKEEFKVDPLVPGLEWLGSVGKDQQVWIQIIIRAHKKEKKHHRLFSKEQDAWKEEAEKIISEDLLKRDPKTKAAALVDDEGGTLKAVLSEGEKEVIAALGRSLSKPAFDVGIRAVYLSTKPEAFIKGFGPGGVSGMFKHFNTENLNGIVPNGDSWMGSISFPWQDYKDIRLNKFSKAALQAYRRRGFFFAPYYSKPFVLNTEELATVYHFPGSVAGVPSLDRIPSKRAEAPANLPV